MIVALRARGWPLLVAALIVLVVQPALAAFPRPALGKKGMVASPHREATEAGLKVLRRGGNAVDAAVATALAISVTLPYSAGIGGGGFLLFRRGATGEVFALDFRERAPLAATRDMFLDRAGKVREGASTDGYLSVGVPGTIAGLAAFHERFGRLPWPAVVEPAIDLAHNGFVVSELFAAYTTEREEVLKRYPASAAVFFRPDGKPWARGELFVQRDLAVTLRRIQKNPTDFYTGRTAALIVDEMARGGGLITAADLVAYKPTWRTPVCGSYRGHKVCSMPPPSSGGVHLLQILNMLEPHDVKAAGWHDPSTLHLLIESMRTAYADRAEHLGDPAFTDVPVAGLIDKRYAMDALKKIPMGKARKSADVRAIPREGLRYESQDTSHLTTVDDQDNAVAMTFTVNWGYGSGVVVPGTGVLLNDEMDDFAAAPGTPNVYGLVGGDANAVGPAKIPLSSMTPTIVEKDGRFWFTAGSPGGSTIITTSLQIVIGVIDYDLDAAAAVAAPRLHHQWLPDIVRLEPHGFDASTKKALEKMGHTLVEEGTWGNASCIKRRDDGVLEGAADPRAEGTAAGL